MTGQNDEVRTKVHQRALTQSIVDSRSVLFNRLVSDVCSVEEACCVLFIQLGVDFVLRSLDAIGCGNQHIDAAAV